MPQGLNGIMRRLLAALMLAMSALSPAFAAEPSLIFGLYPYMTPQRLVTRLAPLRNHLEKASGRDITLLTAPDVPAFLERMRNGEYDLVFVAPHFGRIAERDLAYRRIAMTEYQIRSYVVVRRESSIQSASDLRGKLIAMPPRDSMNYLLLMEAFKGAGLVPGQDLTLREYDSNDNALAAPLRGDTDAGGTGHLVWEGSGTKDRTRSVLVTSTVPGFMVLAHPRLPIPVVEQLRAAAWNFGATPEGRASLEASGYAGWVPIDDGAMQSVDRYLRHLPK